MGTVRLPRSVRASRRVPVFHSIGFLSFAIASAEMFKRQRVSTSSRIRVILRPPGLEGKGHAGKNIPRPKRTANPADRKAEHLPNNRTDARAKMLIPLTEQGLAPTKTLPRAK